MGIVKYGSKLVTGKSQNSGASGIPVGTGVTAIDGSGVVHKTVIDLSSVAMTGTDNTIMWFAEEIFNAPAGSTLILGAIADLTILGSDGVKTGAEGDFGLGSITCDVAGALSGLDQDIIPSTGITLSSFTVDVTGRSAAIISSGAPYDGSSTATKVWLNCIIDSGDFTTTGVLTVTGTVTLTWCSFGDY